MQNLYCEQHAQPIVEHTQNEQRKGLCQICLAQQVNIKQDEIVQTQQKQQNNSQQMNNQLKYDIKLLDQSTIQQIQWCGYFAFNKDQNLLAAGCNYDIKVFQFENGKLTQVQILKGHYGHINALYIGHNNKIYSCSNDETIIIWVQQKAEWKLKYELKGHTKEIYCMIVNKTEEQLITGSKDNSIKCWMKNWLGKWKCVQTLQHDNFVIALNLNESQNLLLSCGRDRKLNIFKQCSNKQWSLVQTITLDDDVNRASFIGDNIIVYQLMSKGILRVYENNSNTFIQKQEVQVKGTGYCSICFPQVFCKQQSILINKHCQFINIIRMNKDNSFVLEQAIDFQTNDLYGTITDDGKYLVTWTHNSQQIQIRQLE